MLAMTAQQSAEKVALSDSDWGSAGGYARKRDGPRLLRTFFLAASCEFRTGRGAARTSRTEQVAISRRGT